MLSTNIRYHYFHTVHYPHYLHRVRISDPKAIFIFLLTLSRDHSCRRHLQIAIHPTTLQRCR